jgi:hypothetical protein
VNFLLRLIINYKSSFFAWPRGAVITDIKERLFLGAK